MSQTDERTFSVNQPLPEPTFSYSNAASITRVVVSRSTTHQPKRAADKIIPLGIMENESIGDANSDMDLLAQQSFEDS